MLAATSYFNWVAKIVVLPALITIIIGLVLYRKNREDDIKTNVLLLAIMSFTSDTIMTTMWSYELNNMWVGNLYILCEFWLLTGIYQQKIQSLRFKRGLRIAQIAFVGGACIYAITSDSITLTSRMRTLESALLLLLSVFYFYETMQNLDSENLFSEPMFWISAGVLLYFAANIFIFVFVQYITKYSVDVNRIIWTIHALFLALFFGLLSLSLCVTPQKKLNF